MPLLAAKNGLGKEYNEFGRLVESRVFGIAVDWFLTGPSATQFFLNSIFEALKKNKKIPDCAYQAERPDCCKMGVDYDVREYIE